VVEQELGCFMPQNGQATAAKPTVARPVSRTAARLARDTAGNTLAIMAAAMIPVTALAGSAIDTARMYVVKVRLQQACDAGVLAGRKFMESSNNTALDTKASDQAKAFFKNNFATGWMQTSAVNFVPRKTADQQVAGTATATVPMTIMKIFAAPDVPLNVTCEARYDVADTDIVFVLDTTGSMACAPDDDDGECNSYSGSAAKVRYTRPSDGNPDQVPGYAGSTAFYVTEKTDSRIAALRTAVKNFYKTMADNVDPSTRVRYGFVTYTSSVNAGGAIIKMSPAFIQGGAGSGTNLATFQSREVTGEYTIGTPDYANTSPAQTRDWCNAQATVRTPAAAKTFSSTTGTASSVGYEWRTPSGTSTARCQKVTKTLGPQWTHRPLEWDVSGYIAGNEVTNPTKIIPAKSRWVGCVEERRTTAGLMTFDQTALPPDLDPTLVPMDNDTRWRPWWPDVTYGRNSLSGPASSVVNGDNESTSRWYGTDERQTLGNVACGKPIRRVRTMTADEVRNYVDATDFRAIGGTYHDVGMIWGTRLLAPNGIFAADLTASDGRQPPKRVIVFLTDGDMAPSVNAFSMYGAEPIAQRVTGGDIARQKAYHNARFLAECAVAKRLNIDVWTVAIGLDTTTELQTCASTTAQALDTTSGDGLSTHFEKIAKQIAMLRVSK